MLVIHARGDGLDQDDKSEGGKNPLSGELFGR